MNAFKKMDRLAKHSNLERQRVAVGRGPQCMPDWEQNGAEAAPRILQRSSASLRAPASF